MQPDYMIERDGVRLAELYYRDCLAVLPELAAGSVDAVVTDPPYLNGDMSGCLEQILRVSRRLVLTPGKVEAFNWIGRVKPVWEYAWINAARSRGGAACMHIGFEPILAYHWPLMPLGTDVLTIPIESDAINPSAKGHPWPKPIKLMVKLITHWSKPGQTVLDPFMGSGTTGVACAQTGRRFIGVEIDPAYFQIAVQRIEATYAQLRLPLEEPERVDKQGELW